jgi:integrase
MHVSIEEAVAAVIETLESRGYSVHAIKATRRCLALLMEFCEEEGGGYTPAAGAEFVSLMSNDGPGKYRRRAWLNPSRCVRLVNSYIQAGQVDLSKPKRSAPPALGAEFMALLRAWQDDMESRGLAETTVRQSVGYAQRYMAFLEGCGVLSIDDADPQSVVAFIGSLGSTHSQSGLRSAMRPIGRFIGFTGNAALKSALGLIKIERNRPIMPWLSAGETGKILSVIHSDAVNLRDRAICLLALTYGLRASDIVALTLEDIDWRAGRISVVQQKTKNPLSLPLLPAVGNAVSGYIISGRPRTSGRSVFLSMIAPHGRLSGHAAIYRVLRRVFRIADIKAPFYGTRLTRHSAATRMFQADVPSPTISAVLGHADPSSADAYIATDAEGMRSCVLPLPKAVMP